ncbi:hypothetical protein E1B28_009681 [Marasmius oreades]|uniref:DUF6534 domain-containing protein n=1 Tax=Marasmius oreades TaxID=181124 RepID=A0A9P7USV6_9AGAR|nr:uncharacterized protein E1B28_009681 [Marasmius oreades]KAG7090574.1 hypothetical protein E1B28_009681 [Marasmius oreades]
MATISIGTNYGALLLGALCSSLLSGVLFMQCFIYGRMYRRDPVGMKIFIGLIWLLDTLHNVSVWAGLWSWFVVDFGAPERIDSIPKGIPLSVSVTGVLTLLVHGFFAYRIYNLLSKYRLLVTIPIVVLALLRVGFALTTAHLMLKDRSLAVFKDHHTWIFSLGLGLSSGVDILITITMMAILHGSRSSSLSLDTVIRSLILYTLENGALTTAATIVSMICWLVMDNLIFLALHFIIAKLYANSVLAMLNCRRALRRQSGSEHTDGGNDLALSPGGVVIFNKTKMHHHHPSHHKSHTAMEVNVERSVEFRVEA